MTTEQITVFAVLTLTLILFGWGKFRHDLVALAALLGVVLTGLVPAEQAFLGFGHPAVITVASVLIISHALKNSGFVDEIAKRLAPYTGNPTMHLISLTAVVTVASAFMNNVGALALMLPVALATASEHNRSPAMLLMPLAFGSILGGMSTMIGTPPNVIIATFRQELTGEQFGMFDFAPVGAPIAVLGLLFVTLIGWRLIPRERLEQNAPKQLFEIDEYLTEIKIPADNELIGQRLGAVTAFKDEEIEIMGLARGNSRAKPVSPYHVLQQGDVLLIKTDPNSLKPVIDALKLELVVDSDSTFAALASEDLHMAEAVVQPGSVLEGRNVAHLRRVTGRTVSLVAMARQGKTLQRRLKRQSFRAGDILLVAGGASDLPDQINELNLLPLAERDLTISRERKVMLAVGIFAVAIILGVVGIVPLTISFILAIMAYILTGILPVRDMYREVDWPVIVLLGAMIPVGRALESTGATDLIANSIVQMTSGLAPIFILALVLVVTMFLSDIINNAATALVMAPISVSIANELNVNVDAFLMSVAIGASCAFLTPIGHQSNTLVMGPGGYRFTDYWRMGLPLEVVIVVVSVFLLTIFWPL